MADQLPQEDHEARLPRCGAWDGPIFGALGVLAADGDRVQCHCCGRWFKFLAAHVVQRHGLLADEYRAIFGLMRRTGLVGAATKAAKREAALPVLSQFWDGSPFKSASPEERSVWVQRRGPRRLEDLEDPDHRAIRQRNMAKATESLRGRTGPDAPFRKAKARQLELLRDPAYRERWRQRNSGAHGGRVVVTCPICGASFERTRYRLRSHRLAFCSEKCRREHLRRRGPETVRHMHELAEQRTARVCVAVAHPSKEWPGRNTALPPAPTASTTGAKPARVRCAVRPSSAIAANATARQAAAPEVARGRPCARD